MKLHDVTKGKNRFCGPAAISAITGRSADEAVEAFHALFPGKKVMGTHGWELNKVLLEYGLYLRSDILPERVTLARWLKNNKARRTPGRVFLLASANHWVVVSGRRIVCGKVLTVMSVRDYPHRRGRVTEVHEVVGEMRRGTPAVIKGLRERRATKARAASKESAVRAKTRRLAEKHGIDIDPDDVHGWWVCPPDGLYADECDDPFDGNHLCGGWDEVERLVEAYVEAVSADNGNASSGRQPCSDEGTHETPSSDPEGDSLPS